MYAFQSASIFHLKGNSCFFSSPFSALRFESFSYEMEMEMEIELEERKTQNGSTSTSTPIEIDS